MYADLLLFGSGFTVNGILFTPLVIGLAVIPKAL